MTPFLGFPFGEGGARASASGAGASGAGASGAGVSRAGTSEASANRADTGEAGTSVADSGLILSANPRIANRRHLTSLQAESPGLLGTSSSMRWIRSQALSSVTSRISFQCSSGIVGMGLNWRTGGG